jgi:serine/threonine protein kinase/tetratricopeptide (TPR) repeat protein
MKNRTATAKAVFDHAHEIDSPAERNAYLDEVCADSPEVRRKVEALLQAYEEAGSSFLKRPPASLSFTGPYVPGRDEPSPSSGVDPETVNTLPPAHHAVPAEGPGAQIGPYRLVEKLGEGGMGTVYLAEQEQPIRRQVALKIIKPGMDSAEVIARFEVERQALTLMDHVNIARVFDAGSTPTSRPYFVMELVKGIPLTRYCNEHTLTVRERLKLFVPVCQAIQHAHQKGVMHRDIKPSNVLVTLHDGKPVPKVIDFGLAKATEQPLTEHEQLTQVGAVAGTLEYMSPEQADPGGVGPDTRTDVYSLGVMLYELLTGTTPLERATLRGAGLIDIVLRIMQEEPPRPSDRVSGLGERLSTIAAQRKTEPAGLVKLLRRELDWIVLKALEKNRNRRYETASGFAQDVQRYLDDERVEACPPTARYRLGKFWRKHRKLLVTAIAFVLVLVGAIVLLTVAYFKVNDARQHEVDERRRAEAAANVTREALAVTWARNRTTRKRAKKLGDTEKTNLSNMLQAYRQLRGEPGPAQEARAKAAETEFLVASVSALTDLVPDAEASYRRAIELYEALASEFQSEGEYRIGLARSYFYLADLLRDRGEREEAKAAYRQAIDLLEKVSAVSPDEAAYRRELADAYNDLGAVLRDGREYAKAEKALREAVTLGEKVVAQEPDSPQHRIDLAASYQNLGNAVRDQGDAKAALAWYGKAIGLLTPINPRPDDATLFLRNAHWDRANALDQRGEHAEAIPDWQQAIELEGKGPAGDHLRLFLKIAETEKKLKAQTKSEGELLYQAAVLHAQATKAAADEEERLLSERYAKRSLELLEQARGAGWFRDPQRINQLKEDKDFPQLPPDDFKRFLQGLEAGTGKDDGSEKK